MTVLQFAACWVAVLFSLLTPNAPPQSASGDFGVELKKVVAAAATNFKDIYDPSTRSLTDDKDETYDVGAKLPGARRGTVWYYRESASWAARYSFVEGEKDGTAAAQRYAELKEMVTKSLGAGWKVKEISRETSTTFRADPEAPGPRVEVRWLRFKSTGTNSIGLVVTPPASGSEAVSRPLTPADCVVLQFEEVNVAFKPKAEDHKVDFKLPYKNTGDKPVKCTITVVSGHRPRDAAGDDYSEWEEKYRQNFDLELAPGETKVVSGTLDWFRRADTMPVIRFPDGKANTASYLRAEFAGGAR